MRKISVFLGLFLTIIFLTSCGGGGKDKTNTYKVTWKNHDGTVLEVDENVLEGTMPSYDGEVPTRDGHTFMGWEPEIKKVTNNVTYVAKFSPIGTEKYTVTWKNHDGTVLEKDLNVLNGTMPEYNGDTPTRLGGYTFTGWTPTISVVTKDIEYTATFRLVEVNTDDYIFVDKGDGYAIIHYLGDDVDVVIPEVYKEKPVISIEQWAFIDNKTMISVVIPNSVVEIKEDAFYNCQVLETVTFGNSVKSIEMNAFYGCTSLESISLPEGFTYLGEGVFMDCEALKSVILPNSIENFGSWMFFGADAVVFNEYENGKYLGNTANPYLVFIGMIDEVAETIKIHNNCKVIANGAFEGLEIKTIDFGTGVKIIGRNAFRSCQQLSNITLPNNIVEIGDMAFQSSSITKITMGDNVKYIGLSAFEYCNSLTNVSLPSGIEYIGMYAFSYCDSLSRGVYDNGYYLGNNENPYLCLVDVDNESISSIIIHEDTKIITSYVFSNCRNLTKVTIPKNVKKIGEGAFYCCKNLTEVTVDDNNTVYEAPNKHAIIEKDTKTLIVGLNTTVIPDGVLHIGNSAFGNCEELVSIVIPDGVMSIGDYAFSYCMKLESVTIPNSVTSIGKNAFGDCYKLASLTLPNNLKFIDIATFNRCKAITSIIIPDSVSYVGNFAFRDCEELADVTFGKNVAVIGENAFESCPLTEIKIPNSVKSIEYGAFYECSEATKIEIGSGVEVIGMLVFGKCHQATTLTVDKENKVFDSRDNSNAIIRKDSNILVVGIKSTVIPNSVTSVGEYAFYGLEGLENIVLGSSVTSIGRYAFAYSSLSSITLNEELTFIDRYAFSSCSNLNMIVIPNSVTDVGANVFRNCTNLKIYAEATEKPTNWDEDWNSSNRPVYWYSETSNTDGAHWRYVDGVPTVWVP